MLKINFIRVLLLAGVCFFAEQTMAQMVESDDMPPQPGEYGKCYAKCKIPDEYDDVSVTVMTKEPSVKKVSSPAVYETQTETILVKEASKKLVPVPAKYETRTESILIKEASTKIVDVAPRYETITERVLVAASSGHWVKKKKAPNCFSANPEDCYVMCWEEVPAKYKTVTKRVIANPGETKVVEIPAEYKTITKKVLVSPATVQETEIPAEYKTITIQVLVSPASTDEVTVPAEYKTITERRLVRAGGYTKWVEILCAEKTNLSTVRMVQQALKDRGYDPGPIDGILGVQTKAALEKYQNDNRLPVGNLNLETLSALGINP